MEFSGHYARKKKSIIPKSILLKWTGNNCKNCDEPSHDSVVLVMILPHFTSARKKAAFFKACVSVILFAKHQEHFCKNDIKY